MLKIVPAQHPVYLKIPLQLLPDAPNAHCLSAVFETMIVNPVVPNRFGIDPSQNALCGRLIPKRRIFAPFWDLPPSGGRAGHPNPKTIWNNTFATAEPPCSTTVTPSAPPYKTTLQHHGNALHHPKAPQNRPELPGRILDTPE